MSRLNKKNVELRKRVSKLNKTNVEVEKRMSWLKERNVEFEKQRWYAKTTIKRLHASMKLKNAISHYALVSSRANNSDAPRLKLRTNSCHSRLRRNTAGK